MYSCKLKDAYSISKMLIFSECLPLIDNVKVMYTCLEKHAEKCWQRNIIFYLLCIIQPEILAVAVRQELLLLAPCFTSR